MSNVIRVVPLTEDELTDIQLTVASRILELYQQSNHGHINKDEAATEITRLSQVIQKCSKYSTSKTPRSQTSA